MMHEINFEAVKVDLSRNAEELYTMVALADDAQAPTNYVIFQKTTDPDELREDSELKGIYVECNGESCYNCCQEISLRENMLQFEVKRTKFCITIPDNYLTKEFDRYMTVLFDELYSHKH